MSNDLNSDQKKAVEAADTPLLIVAGAGTGKTRTLTHRLVYLIKSGVLPEKICALTFTNKAAREMEGRVAALTMTNDNNDDGHRHGYRHGKPRDIFGAPGPFLGTFHSFGARILRREARNLGRNPNFAIFDDGDSFSLIKKVLKSVHAEKADATPGDILGKISALKNHMTTFEELRLTRWPANRLALEVFDRYEGALAENNAFDFDDLIDKVVVLLEEHPDILEKYHHRFSHFLVDEYQDLNNRQYDLIRLLAGKHKQLSVVGDDQQTIYSWRGSNFEIFLNFERDWPGAQTVVLDQNYRSTSSIISAASAVIQNNLRQKPKKLWTANEAGLPVRLVETGDEAHEAEWIADAIASAHDDDDNNNNNDGERHGHRDGHGTSTAVLYRTNAQSRAIEQALIAAWIPYRVYGGLRFYERREIKDIVAVLRHAVNPRDAVSLERIDKTFTRGVFRRLEPQLGTIGKMIPADAIRTVIATTDYAEYVRKNLTNPDERMENIAELIHFAESFEDLPTFLERTALVQATDAPFESGGATITSNDDKVGHRHSHRHIEPVTLTTIHMAKGLEFDRVFVAGCVEGLLPHGRSMSSDRELEEERRLMYVAMTRARKELLLSFYDIPSRFLLELSNEHIKFENLVGDEQKFSGSEERYITLD